MNWLQKVRYLIERQQNKTPSDPYSYDINPKEPTWSLNELENIYQDYPWLPKVYNEFLKEFDGISIAFCRFYGSKQGVAIVLKKEIELHQPLLMDNYFPFASDADGSVFLFDKNGRVRWWDIEDYDFEQEPKILAETFEEFVGKCLLGDRYAEFDYINLEENSFYKFLQSQNWA